MDNGVDVSTETAHPILRLEIHQEIAALEALWKDFQKSAICGPHDTWEWNSAWATTAGRKEEMAIVVGRDASDDVLFILPLVVRKHWGCRIAEWLASEQGNYSSGLFHPNAWNNTRLDLPSGRRLINLVLDHLPDVDAIHLDKLPELTGFQRTPFSSLRTIPEASPGHCFSFGSDWEGHYQRQFNSKSRSNMRRNERRLVQDAGAVSEDVTGSDTCAEFLSKTISQKSEFFKEHGIANFFDKPGVTEFFQTLLTNRNSQSGLDTRLCVMHADGELLSSKIGVNHRGTHYGLISSTTPGDLRRYGPGSVLFKELVRLLGEFEIENLDCGAGEDDTKLKWCTAQRTRAHALFPANAVGIIYVAALGLTLKAKLFIKNNPGMWHQAKRFRLWLACVLNSGGEECKELEKMPANPAEPSRLPSTSPAETGTSR